ncbi:MAG: DUF3857 domain-containing protein [Polyangiales bacterium]
MTATHKTSTTALAAAVLSLAAPASAQRTPEEWMSAHARDALAQRAEARGALPLLRLRALRDHVDPAALLERVHAVAAAPVMPAPRRALALHVESELRRDLGQTSAADAIAHRLGFITSWWVVGPFDNEGRAGLARAFGPEEDPVGALDAARAFEGRERPARWRRMPAVAVGGYVPLDAAVRPSVNVCAYAATAVRSAAAGPAVLWLGATGAVRASVNGATVFEDGAVRRAWPDRAGVTVRLRAGLNRVLLKVCTDERGLGFYARFTRPDGSPRPDVVAVDDPRAVPLDRPVRPAPGAPTPNPPAPQGVFEALQRAVTDAAPPRAAEDLARYLALTGSDDPAAPRAADLAERAARAQETADAWLLLADLTSDRNRRLEALRRAYALAPRDAHVLTAVAHERRVGVRAEEALPWLDEAQRLDPDYALPRVERALTLDAAGLPLAALAEADAALALAPRSVAVLRARLQLAERAGQADVAQATRRAIVRLRDTDVEAHEGLARDARQTGDRAAARREAERILALRPESLSSYLRAAEYFEAIGEGGLAVGTLARAVEVCPDEASLWTAKGELEERLARRDDARASMRQALALRPQDASLRRHLEALEPAQARADEAAAEEPAAFLARRGEAGAAADYHLRALQELTVRTVYANGLSGNFRQVAYEVRDEQGAREGRAYAMQYDPLSQRFEMRGAWVHHADGSRDEGTQVEEFDVNSDPATRMYFSNRVVQVTFPRLAPGDVVEVRWRVDDVSSRNAFADYFGDLEVVQAGVPRARWSYVLRAPASRSFFVHAAALSDGRALRAEERDEGDVRVRSWTADDVPALPPEENSPGSTERAGYLHLSTYRSWEDVGRWYWGLVRDQLVADDRMRAAVREATRGLTEPRDRVRAIYNWVISHTRYVALEFGIHGFKPYPVAQVCARGFGDCKDKASTIVAMLREAGVDASIALVRTRRNGRIDTSPASLAIFDHAIAYVPSLDLFLDGTAEHSAMDEFPTGDQGVMALVVNQRGEARLVETPVYTPDRNVTTVRAEVTLQANGGATAHVTQTERGPDAAGLRARLEAEATRVERVEDGLRDHFPGARVTAVRTGDLTRVDEPARVEYEAAIPVFGTRQGDSLLFAPVIPMNLARSWAARSSRTRDVVLGTPSTWDETRTIRLPAGATVAETPPAARIESPFGRLEYTIEANGSELRVRRVLVLSRDRVTPQEYAAFRTFAQQVDDALARRVTVRMPAAEAR